jgi:hypothetical protein
MATQAGRSGVPPAGQQPAEPDPDPTTTPSLLEREFDKLRQITSNPGERRDAKRWPVDWPLEGWLQIDDGGGPPIPVDLVNLSCSGAAVVLAGHHELRPGQRGRLITQAHGAGCGERAVRCCWLRRDDRGQTVGLTFETGADS